MIGSVCPSLVSYAIEKDIDINTTLILLNIAKKIKVKKLGIHTYNDPELITIHKGWPFTEENSMFSTEQEYGSKDWKEPVTWVLYHKFQEEFSQYSWQDWIGGCGNENQHSLPSLGYDERFNKKLNFIQGVYTLSADKKFYNFNNVGSYKNKLW